GEMQFGRGRTYRTFIYILLTAGLGGGVIIDGDYFRGENNASGRIGFIDLDDGRTLQDLVSLSGVATRLDSAGLPLRPPEALAGDDPALVAVMAQWIEDAAQALAGPLKTLNCVLDLGAVLIGGRLPEPLVERLAARLNALLVSDRPLVVVAPVLKADLAADAPAVGAAILPFNAALLPSDTILMAPDPPLS
ncbi:MAG: ROK family protein, partial [Sphingomonadaceae bacterium]|nr:ROK family protein [Sphingomonadaceae bacterium]